MTFELISVRAELTHGRMIKPLLPLLMQGTVYEKTNAEVEMKKINREEFWEQAKVGVGQNQGW